MRKMKKNAWKFFRWLVRWFLFKDSDSRLITPPLLLLLYMKSWAMQYGFSLGEEFTNKKAFTMSKLKADFFQSISNQSKIYFAKQVFDIYDIQCFRSLFRFTVYLFWLWLQYWVCMNLFQLWDVESVEYSMLYPPPDLSSDLEIEYVPDTIVFILQSLHTHQLYSGILHFT